MPREFFTLSPTPFDEIEGLFTGKLRCGDVTFSKNGGAGLGGVSGFLRLTMLVVPLRRRRGLSLHNPSENDGLDSCFIPNGAIVPDELSRDLLRCAELVFWRKY